MSETKLFGTVCLGIPANEGEVVEKVLLFFPADEGRRVIQKKNHDSFLKELQTVVGSMRGVFDFSYLPQAPCEVDGVVFQEFQSLTGSGRTLFLEYYSPKN